MNMEQQFLQAREDVRLIDILSGSFGAAISFVEAAPGGYYKHVWRLVSRRIAQPASDSTAQFDIPSRRALDVTRRPRVS